MQLLPYRSVTVGLGSMYWIVISFFFRLPSTERGGTEYAEKYRQVEAQKLDAFGTDQFVYKLGKKNFLF